ncbi:hypothetical protein BTA51_29165, partial [Hahella sp. CCB-MM4]|uniref:hypothetical protein n=1 Tax=Hahella sp. (strain CCB-MM4) TaxID=1926491 RepID=UPI000BD2A5BE
MPATGNSDPTAARVLLGRLARSVWTSLVAYGSLWIPVDQNPFWQQYLRSAAPDHRSGDPSPAPVR